MTDTTQTDMALKEDGVAPAAWKKMKELASADNTDIELRDEDGNMLLDNKADNATSKPPKVVPVGAGIIAHDQLHAFIRRIENLEEEKAAIAADIKEIYLEAKGTGFDVKIMRLVVALRKKETAERQEEQSLLDLYLHALGMALD